MNENKINDDEIRETLEKFLSVSTKSSDGIFDIFEQVEGAQKYGDEPLKRFIYIPGTRKDRVLLVAHADTVWDKNWIPEINDCPQTLKSYKGCYFNSDSYAQCGLGADDRAGCAILYLLKNSGHSILIVDGEEHGQLGSHFLKDNYPEIYKELNEHQYMMQFDRRGKKDFKNYKISVSDEFKKYIKKEFKFRDAGTKSKSDIVVLCDRVCGVNLSVGYHNEHTNYETLCYKEWLNTFNKTKNMLEKPQYRFETTKYMENSFDKE